MILAAGDCPAFCPTVCPPDHTKCPGGSDPAGCPVPETCMPPTFGHGGVACPAACPVPCPEDHTWCDGGVDANGCWMPNTCVSNSGKHFFFNVNHYTKKVELLMRTKSKQFLIKSFK